MAISQDIRSLVNSTLFVDTHEHLWTEKSRVEAKAWGDAAGLPHADFAVLFSQYSDSDLIVAGMPYDPVLPSKGYVLQRIHTVEMEPLEKWRFIEPWYEACRHTGYQQCVRESVRALYGESDLREENVEAISEKISASVQPGYYRRILNDVAGLEHCQVNCLDALFFRHDEEQPDLLCQDLTTVWLASFPEVQKIAEAVGREISNLTDWRELIDCVFETYGPKAIAVKNQSAYRRRLNYAQVSFDEAAPLFERYIKSPDNLTENEIKAIGDHLFHYTLEKAAEYHLPVKLHMGYYASVDTMPLARVSQNASDICPILQAHPNVQFVLMHINYPYQVEAIALAKQYTNVFIDLCWAWIVNPLACVRFLKEYLPAAPANKILTFGGDLVAVEMVPGHAAIARKGLTQALSELVEEGWIAPPDIEKLVPRLMNGNAHELFDYEGTLSAWR